MSNSDETPGPGKKVAPIHQAIFEDSGLDAHSLCCPICRYEWTHMGEPIKYDSLDAYKATWAGRGDLTVIPMDSECGHEWELCLGYHKGQVFIFVRWYEGQE